MKLVVLYYFRSVAIINIAIMSLFEQVSYFNEAEGDRGMQLIRSTFLSIDHFQNVLYCLVLNDKIFLSCTI